MSDLVCFSDKLIKSTNENELSDDSDSSSYSTELYETDVKDFLNLDGYDNKIE